ncbi:MAG: hypothetical protein AB1468_04725, partial [Candidatus Micrarchaeota archaeon]
MERKIALCTLAFLILLFGCLRTNPEQEVRVISISRDLSCYERGQCLCFVCHNESQEIWSFNPLNPLEITTPSLYGGWCRFESCNITHRVRPLIEGTEDPPTGDYLRFFMYGQGPSFAAFDEANPYCNNSLSLAVRWMTGNAFEPPTIPLGSRAACFLKNNVIPAYLYYTGGTNIDAVRMGAIADALDTNVWDENRIIGPVIISPEVEFDASNPATVDAVREQIRAIKANCSGCLIALTPRENDREGVSAVLNDTSNPLLTAEMARDVDMIGQMALLNRQPDCDYRKALYDKMNFSRWALANFNKSTIIFYFGIANASNDLAPGGTDSCNWTNELIAEAFDYLYIHTPDMVDSGIIGLAYYQWKDASLNPYADCVTNPDQTKCRFGLVNGSFDEKHP